MSNTENNDIWEEDRLVSGLKQGREEAFQVLVRQYQARLFGIAFGMTQDREESQDIVQDVFLKVHQNIHRFEGKSKLSTWLHRITVNHCLNLKRRWINRFRWHHRPLEMDAGDYPELGSSEHYPEILYRNKEFRYQFRKVLKKLPADARAVFVLKELEGLSYDEIAKTLQIKRGTVSSRLFYARRKLRSALKAYLDGV